MTQISEFRKITTKDVKFMLEIQDDRTARKIIDDIKQSTGAPMVLYCHFKRYFKI
jgi:hypothetical protein